MDVSRVERAKGRSEKRGDNKVTRGLDLTGSQRDYYEVLNQMGRNGVRRAMTSDPPDLNYFQIITHRFLTSKPRPQLIHMG